MWRVLVGALIGLFLGEIIEEFWWIKIYAGNWEGAEKGKLAAVLATYLSGAIGRWCGAVIGAIAGAIRAVLIALKQPKLEAKLPEPKLEAKTK